MVKWFRGDKEFSSWEPGCGGKKRIGEPHLDDDPDRCEVILDTTGADCPRCVRTIEHVGRRVKGVKQIHVDPVRHEIHVSYQGSAAVPRVIARIVERLGYEAIPRPAGSHTS